MHLHYKMPIFLQNIDLETMSSMLSPEAGYMTSKHLRFHDPHVMVDQGMLKYLCHCWKAKVLQSKLGGHSISHVISTQNITVAIIWTMLPSQWRHGVSNIKATVYSTSCSGWNVISTKAPPQCPLWGRYMSITKGQWCGKCSRVKTPSC